MLSKCAVLVLLLHGIAAYLFGWTWPVEVPRLIHSFMEENEQRYLDGIVVAAVNGDAALAIEGGEVVIAIPEVRAPSQITTPHVLGGFILIEHPHQIRSLYSNIIPHNTLSDRVTEGQTIGTINRSRRQAHVALRIIDRTQQTYLNPLFILPKLKDNFRPTVPSSRIEMLDSFTGEAYFNVLLTVHDRRIYDSQIQPTIPPIISVDYGGQRATIVLDSISVRHGKKFISSTNRLLNDTISFSWQYRLGPFSFTTDTAAATVRVTDYFSNTRTLSVSVIDEAFRN